MWDYARSRPQDPENVEALIRDLDRALEAWRADPARFAEHFGFFADYLMATAVPVTGYPWLLDKAMALQREGAAAPAITGEVALRLEFLGRQLDIVVTTRDAGPAAMAARLASHCSAVQDRLIGMTPVQLGDVVRQAVLWMDQAAGVQEWSAAASAGELAARALWNLMAVTDADLGSSLWPGSPPCPRTSLACCCGRIGRMTRLWSWRSDVSTSRADGVKQLTLTRCCGTSTRSS